MFVFKFMSAKFTIFNLINIVNWDISEGIGVLVDIFNIFV